MSVALVVVSCLLALPAFSQANDCAGQPDGQGCDDGNLCTTFDVCNGGWCFGSPVADGTACDDQNPCTTDDVCQWGWCGGSALADGTVCNDGTP